MTTTIGRRGLLGMLVGLPLAACVAETAPPSRRMARFREVRVDTSPFAAKGVSNYAAKVAGRLRIAVAEAFAGRLVPGDGGAPVLVIEVSEVRLASGVGGSSHGMFDRSESDDIMVGALVPTSAKGTVIERRRHFASNDAAAAGDWRAPDNEERRLEALCRLYAAWAVREFE